MSDQLSLNESSVLALLGQSPCVLLVWRSLAEALRARRLMLQALQSGFAGTWLLAGPSGHRALFEMDPLPADWLDHLDEFRRPLDSWLAKRSLLKRLHALCEQSACKGCVLVGQVDHRLVDLYQRVFGERLLRMNPLTEQELPMVPVLQAGPSALARITQRLRSQAPNSFRVLIVSDQTQEPLGALSRLSAQLQTLQAEAGRLGLVPLFSYGLIGSPDRLTLRKAREAFASLQLLEASHLLGELAYADSVLTDSAEVRLLATEMGRTLTRVL